RGSLRSASPKRASPRVRKPTASATRCSELGRARSPLARCAPSRRTDVRGCAAAARPPGLAAGLGRVAADDRRLRPARSALPARERAAAAAPARSCAARTGRTATMNDTAFRYRNDSLFVEDVELASIAREHGTPAYVYSR